MIQLGLARLVGRAQVAERWARVHRSNAKRMYRGFVSLRGVYIKLGQVLSIMGSFLPDAFARELEGLQDLVPPRPYKEIRTAVRRSLGQSPEKLFAHFSHVALAAASLGQVHEARTHEGHRVAVKVLYPNIATIIKVDMRVLSWALRVYRWFVPIQQLDRVHRQLCDMLARETDLDNEAACVKRMAANFASDPDVLLPTVFADLSSREVLTMTFMEGAKISKAEALRELGLDPNDVVKKLIEAFYKQLFHDRFFHADPHPGNFFVQRNDEGKPRIVVLDLGAASEVPSRVTDGLLDILKGIVTRNDALVLKGIEHMGFVAENGDRPLLERVVKTYFERLLNLDIKDFSKISTEVAQNFADPNLKRDQLRELMRSVSYPDGWFYVERACVIMFGLSAQLAPTVNTLRIGFPYVMGLLAAQNSPSRRVAADSPNTA